MAQIVLIRHGNTFEADQTPTYVGGRTDMNLTAKGLEQGLAIAAMMRDRFTPLASITSGPLIRTRRFAEMIQATTNAAVTIDERLREIDYGSWENRTTADVIATHGASCVEAWEQEGQWPADMGWSPDPVTIAGNVRAILDEQRQGLASSPDSHRAIVTSNGVLRIVYSLVTGQKADKEAKVKTGHYCLLSRQNDGWCIDGWNLKP